MEKEAKEKTKSEAKEKTKSEFSEVFKQASLALIDLQDGTDAMIRIKIKKGESVSRLNNLKKDLVRIKKDLSVYESE